METETQVKERPILFSGEMVRAILAGRKTQTRRVVKPQPDEKYFIGPCGYVASNWSLWEYGELPSNWGPNHNGCRCKEVKCPYGVPGQIIERPTMAGWYDVKWERNDDWRRIWVFDGCECWGDSPTDDMESINLDGPPHSFKTPGDRLLVRETFQGPILCTESKTGYLIEKVFYRATDERRTNHKGNPIKWTSPRYMPRWASRLLLEITGIRVERVQDISLSDVHAEGCLLVEFEDGKMHFGSLWNRINLNRGFGWDKNPWVWVVEFKVINPNPESPGDE